MNDNGYPILTKAQARRRGIALKDWSTLGLDAAQNYALCTDPADPVTSLIAYYATLALAVAASDAYGNPRPTIMVNPDQ